MVVTMGEDAEYKTGPQAEPATHEQTDRREGEPCKPLLCWDEGELGYIWDWDPGTRVLDIFSGLHDFEGIGTTSFLSVGVPSEQDIDVLAEYRASGPEEATHEVIVLVQKDIERLADYAEEARRIAETIDEEVVAGMFEAMVVFMDEYPDREFFLFARTL